MRNAMRYGLCAVLPILLVLSMAGQVAVATNAVTTSDGLSTNGNSALPSISGMGRLGVLKSANFNTTSDQAIAIASGVTAYQLTSIIVTNCSTSLTLAAGGFYTSTSKGGTVIVAAIQVYSAATGATVLVLPTVAATGQIRLTAATVYLSLTTAQGGAATCDVYLMGNDLT